jgi:hypothetical protein
MSLTWNATGVRIRQRRASSHDYQSWNDGAVIPRAVAKRTKPEEQQVHDKETQVKGARLDVQHFSIFCSSHLTKLNRKSSTTITRP